MEAGTEPAAPVMSEDEMRREAIKRIKKQRDFRTHCVMYVIVNAFLVGIWALTGQGFFWPAFVMGGWGIGLAANAWDVYGNRQVITNEQVDREVERLKG